MGLKRGHLGPTPQLEQLLSNIRLSVHSVESGRPWEHLATVDAWTEHPQTGMEGGSQSTECSLVLERLSDHSTC